jgi:hypothetical protein
MKESMICIKKYQSMDKESIINSLFLRKQEYGFGRDEVPKPLRIWRLSSFPSVTRYPYSYRALSSFMAFPVYRWQVPKDSKPGGDRVFNQHRPLQNCPALGGIHHTK